jgi:hypothetical protein
MFPDIGLGVEPLGLDAHEIVGIRRLLNRGVARLRLFQVVDLPVEGLSAAARQITTEYRVIPCIPEACRPGEDTGGR